LPQHVLRFWETRFSQIKPLKRGGNRRYYRPEDVELLRSIRHLLYDKGLTIRGVQKMLREQGAAAIRDDVGEEPEAFAPAPQAPDVAELRRALDDLREAERLLESARPS
jgi:DNA-binding transcriptional MerR regulator